MHDVDRPQLESFESYENYETWDGELDRFIGPGPRGQAGRSPGARLAAAIRRLGFMPTQHFVDRINQRAAAQGIRWDPRAFPAEFANARHYRQTRPGHNTRIAVVRGVPIVYRVGGNQGNKVVLITALPPEDRLPPVVPTRYPVQREVYEHEGGRTPGAPAALRRMAAARRALKAAQADATRLTRAMDAQRAALAGGRMPLSSVDLSMGRKLPEVAAKLRDARAEFNAARGDVIDVWNARRQARAKTVYR